MAEIAVRVAIEVLKKTSDLIVKEGSRLSRLQEEISWIERQMRRIRLYSKDFEHKQGENETMANFVREIRELAFDVEDTMEEYFPILLKRIGRKSFLERITHVFSDRSGALNFLKEVEAIKRRIKDLKDARQIFGINETSSVEREDWDNRRYVRRDNEPNIIGLEDHTRSLVAEMHDEDPRLRVILITGMAGLGKTTMAKKVYNTVRTNFKLSAWVYVSQQPNIKNIWTDIAKQVGLKIEKWEDSDVEILHEHLSQDRYVIVIDDIWQTSTWDDIRIAIPTNSKRGSRIILTSRNMKVGDCSSLFVLKPLGEIYSKQLFETCLGSVQTDPPGLKEIGDKILYRCGGVPLAIVVVSGLLKWKERSINTWNGVLEQMDQGENEFSKTFALSYLDLPTNLKPCFLYFGIFPEDHEIKTFDLINLWAAEGFIKGSKVREVEDVGDDYLNHLIARNLIEVVQKDSDGTVKSCRIHDILRSLCIHVAKDINFFIGSMDLMDLRNFNGGVVRRVTTHGMSFGDHISLNCQTPKLRSFLCFKDDICTSNVKLFRNFRKDFNLGRVLYLECQFCSGKFLKVIWSFENLTYLKLCICFPDELNRNGRIEIPNSIIILEILVTLDIQIVGYGILIFPMVIWNMKRLRHLLFNVNFLLEVSCTYKGFDPNIIPFQNFQTLELPYEIFDADWLHKLSEVRTLIFIDAIRELRGSREKIVKLIMSSNLVLNKLKTLKLVASPRGERLPSTMFKMVGYQNLSNLFLFRLDIEPWPQPDELPPNLTKIVLVFCKLKEDPFVVMKKMPKLRDLKLCSCECALREWVCTGEPGNFPQLEQLHILHPRGPTEITIEDEGMPRLMECVIPNGEHRLKIPTRINQILRTELAVDWVLDAGI